MNIPVVLPIVTIDVAADGQLAVCIDGEPHREDTPMGRGDLGRVVEDIATGVGEPVRVEVREADGTTYTDIVLPPDQTNAAASVSGGTEASAVPHTRAGGITGHGFTPGESVAVAYVLAEQTADEQGTATLGLPPVMLASRAASLVLVGLASGTSVRVAVAS